MDQVELRRAAQRMGDVERLPDAPVELGSSAYGRSQTPSSRARVIESSVANSVTSTPRAARPSASSPVTSSHGP